MKAVGQFAGGINAYHAGQYTRSVMNTNAQNALNAGVSERDMVRYKSGMEMGAQAVAQGGSGFQSGTGSALDALRQSAINRELDIATSRARASAAATNYQNQGTIAYRQGKSAMAGGIISGAMTIADQVASAMAGGAGGGNADIGNGDVGFGGPAIGAPDLGAAMSTDFG